MGIEKRRAERIVPAQQPDGKITLLVKEKQFNVLKIKDVSPFGIGIQTNVQLKIGDFVGFRYHNDELTIETSGSVEWSDIQGQNCWAGIYFNPADMENNMLFCMTMSGQ